MIRASAEHAERINEWIWRDNGSRHPFLAQLLSDRMNVALVEGESVALFVWRGPWIYEVHLAYAHRGTEALNLCRAMLDWMKQNAGARLFWCSIPWDESKQSRKVRLFTRRMGWKSHGLADLAHGRCELYIGE